jgi:3-isopropylmalate dehydrogenase
MLLRHSLGLEQEARAVEGAVTLALEEGNLTADLGAGKPLSTSQMGRAVRERLEAGADAWQRSFGQLIL